MAASTAGLVPITKAFLAKFYDKYPFTPLAEEIPSLATSLHDHALRALKLRSSAADDSGNAALIKDINASPPHKIDENLWRNREQIEEITLLLKKDKWPASLKAGGTAELESVASRLEKLGADLQHLLTTLEGFQSAQSERIFNMVLTYMPQDFRSVLLRQQRERSEKRRQAEVDNLMAQGGTIHDKYGLLWNQQMERRRQLAQLGSSTGVFRTLVKFLVGVPQVLLDFVCKINDDHGPMEEQRQRYGPPLYKLTSFVVLLRVFLVVWWSSFDSTDMPTNETMELLEQSVKVYTTEFTRYLEFMGEVFKKSPFFITPEEAGTASETAAANDFKEATIIAGKTHEVLITVECEGSLVAWDFRLTSGKDVGFSVEFLDASRTKRPMLPYQRYESHQGSFYSPAVGNYRLLWDNSYSTFYRKTIKYKVDSIPPVPEVPTSEDVEPSTESGNPIENSVKDMSLNEGLESPPSSDSTVAHASEPELPIADVEKSSDPESRPSSDSTVAHASEPELPIADVEKSSDPESRPSSDSTVAHASEPELPIADVERSSDLESRPSSDSTVAHASERELPIADVVYS